MAEADSTSPESLPKVLPREEETASRGGTNDGTDLAELETAWVENSLSEHTVEAAALRNELARAYIKNLDADRDMRKQYAGRILKYLEIYSLSVGGIVLLVGFQAKGFKLEKEVMAALVGSTAVASIGLVGFIARGLFRAPPGPPSTTKEP